jgi:50S ribosomal protein L16 3-hydroxylase
LSEGPALILRAGPFFLCGEARVKQSLLSSDLGIDDFIKGYWNRESLLLKSGLSGASALASFEEILDFGGEAQFESRMVIEKLGGKDYKCLPGPIELSELDMDDDERWTLLAHGLNLYNPDFFELAQKFNFIPNWMFDDIMASYSKEGASVGAHIDHYGVFIIQGLGKRKWLLENNPNPAYIPNLEIKLLAEFHPDQEYILESGDVLYIPPGVAHHGISLTDSLSYSVAFRSYSDFDYLASFGDFGADTSKGGVAIHPVVESSSETDVITDQYILKIQDSFKKAISDKEQLSIWLGQMMSAPRMAFEKGEKLCSEQFFGLLTQGAELFHSEHLRMNVDESRVHLFIGGKRFDYSQQAYLFFQKIVGAAPFESFTLNDQKLGEDVKKILYSLHCEGVFFYED